MEWQRMKKLLVAFLFLMMFCSEVFASASIVINNIHAQPVMDKVLFNVTRDIPTSRVETINPYSLVLLSTDSVSIGLFGTGIRENRMIFNFVPNGNDILLSLSETCTIIRPNGMRESDQVGDYITHYTYLREIKRYFNGRYLFGYETTDKKNGEGYVIGEITKGSAFEEAGIKSGDVMISINDIMVRKEKQKYLNGMMLEESDRTKPAKFVIMQAGKEKVFNVTAKFSPGEYQGNNGETAPIVNNNTNSNDNNSATAGAAPVPQKKNVYTIDRKYENGDHYVGEVDAASRNLQGKGVYTFANGDRYEGEFFANRLQGKGIFKYANGDCYEGEFKDSKYNGKGILTHADGTKEEGNFADGKYMGPASE